MRKQRELRRIRKENARLEQENNRLKTHYQSLEQEVEKTRRLHHDIRKHIDVLQTLMQNLESHSDTYHSLQNLTERMERILPITYVEHTVLNAVIINKAQTCLSHNIDFQCEIHSFSSVTMSDCDMVVLFSNLLDNAIEECLRLPKDAVKNIVLKSGQHANNTILICQNSTEKVTLTTNTGTYTTEKDDHFTHGLGLQILEELLDTYYGTLHLSIEQNMFQNTILLPLKKESLC